MTGVDFRKVFEVEELVGFNLPIQDFSSGVLTVGDKKHDVIAIMCDSVLPDDKIEKLSALKKRVVKIGSANYRYAPEIVKTVVYIKA